MTDWEAQRPPRAPSRWQAPGIFVNLELGVSFSPDDRTHTKALKYTSRRMEERLHDERIRRQHEGGFYLQPADLGLPPASLMVGDGVQADRQTRHQQQQRQRRLGVRTREQHERGTSAPPTLTDRHQPVSPINSYVPHITPLQHTQSLPIDRTNQPLPPTPSQFRLGEDDMPWSVPPWYRSPEQPEFAAPTVVGIDQDNRRLDDPQRVRDLETLHQAMMTVDSLDHDGWEPWTWDSVGEMPRGPRSIGWAVSSQDAAPRSPPVPAPPPYVVSQWEQTYGRSSVRPRSSYS